MAKELRFIILACIICVAAIVKVTLDKREINRKIEERDSMLTKISELAILYHNKSFEYKDKLDSIYGR